MKNKQGRYMALWFAILASGCNQNAEESIDPSKKHPTGFSAEHSPTVIGIWTCEAGDFVRFYDPTKPLKWDPESGRSLGIGRYTLTINHDLTVTERFDDGGGSHGRASADGTSIELDGDIYEVILASDAQLKLLRIKGRLPATDGMLILGSLCQREQYLPPKESMATKTMQHRGELYANGRAVHSHTAVNVRTPIGDDSQHDAKRPPEREPLGRDDNSYVQQTLKDLASKCSISDADGYPVVFYPTPLPSSSVAFTKEEVCAAARGMVNRLSDLRRSFVNEWCKPADEVVRQTTGGTTSRDYELALQHLDNGIRSGDVSLHDAATLRGTLKYCRSESDRVRLQKDMHQEKYGAWRSIYSFGNFVHKGKQCRGYIAEVTSDRGSNYALLGYGDCTGFDSHVNEGVYDKTTRPTGILGGDYILSVLHYDGAVPGRTVDDGKPEDFVKGGKDVTPSISPSRYIDDSAGTEDHQPPVRDDSQRYASEDNSRSGHSPTADDVINSLGEDSQHDAKRPSERTPLGRDDNSYARQMISAASANDESRIAEIKRTLEGRPKLEHGDRKTARKRNGQGLLLFQGGKYVESARLFHEAYDADPADIEVHNNIGYALLMAGDLAEAEKVLTDVLTVAPGRGAAWGHLGHVYAKQGKLQLAIASFSNVLRFSADPAKTAAFFVKLSNTDPDSGVREAAKGVLAKWHSENVTLPLQETERAAAENKQTNRNRGNEFPTVRIRTASVKPNIVKRGESIRVDVDYSLWVPEGMQEIDVVQGMALTKDGTKLADFKPRYDRFESGGYVYSTTLPIPHNANPGTYIVQAKVQAGSGTDSKQSSFSVR